MTIDITLIKKLRDQTSAGVADCRAALEASKGDMAKAKKYLQKKSLEKADKKSDRETKSGLIFSYIHGATGPSQGGRVGALVKVACETDFVAKTEEFQDLCKEIAMQVASMNPESVEELLKQDYIRDTQKTIEDLVKETVGKLGENITIDHITRFAIE